MTNVSCVGSVHIYAIKKFELIACAHSFFCENVFFSTLNRFTKIARDLNFVIFYFMLDIVPFLVYYHWTKHIGVIKMDVKMILNMLELRRR